MLDKMISFGNNVVTLCKEEDFAVFKMENSTGEGTMSYYQIFPGIAILYNDFHMENCYSEFQAEKDMFCIEHCREGRIQWDIGSGNYLYLGAGDLRIENRRNHDGHFEFPLRHYHGISVAFYGQEAEKSLQTALKGFPVKLQDLKEKFCQTKNAYVLRAKPTIEHIFLEMYALPNEIKKCYLQIKVLELLLYLSVLDISGNYEERPYFYKAQVEKVKAIERFMTEHLEKHYTLNELSQYFDISLTSMKNCFKGIYGTSIYAYMRHYRMNRAAAMLRQTDQNIVSIAGQVGYDSHSKFSVAFKEVMGKTPLEYRKSIV